MHEALSGIDLRALWRGLRPHLRPTLFLEPERLSETLGVRLRLASETFQHTGSFKFRAALAVAQHAKTGHLLAASSGNFGAALALAARRSGKRCTIVMPATSARVKVANVAGYGAEVDLVDTATKTRAARVAELAETLGDVAVVSAYDDPFVIAGNASLGAEIFETDAPDVVVVPVGGGGLSSGIVVARDAFGAKAAILGAEPALGNDAARSLREGRLVANETEPPTICDGARTLSLGKRNFAILREGLEGIAEVDEATVERAVRILFELANLKVEPTGALAVAAVLQDPARFAGKKVTCVVSGGNVDAELYARLLGDRGSASR